MLKLLRLGEIHGDLCHTSARIPANNVTALSLYYRDLIGTVGYRVFGLRSASTYVGECAHHLRRIGANFVGQDSVQRTKKRLEMSPLFERVFVDRLSHLFRTWRAN